MIAIRTTGKNHPVGAVPDRDNRGQIRTPGRNGPRPRVPGPTESLWERSMIATRTTRQSNQESINE